ncbi:hAT transposon superfamily [Euphorbia peplus]|nr:hAT transposon superfamily [Euphorbia peplus]
MESENQNSQSTTAPTRTRGKSDPAWEHFSVTRDAKGKDIFKCLFCSNEYKGGGINRMKYHLAKIKGQISSCNKVPYDVCVNIKILIQSSQKEKELTMKRKLSDYDENPFGAEMEEDQVQEFNPSQQDLSQMEEKRKDKQAASLSNLFPPRTSA